MIEYDYFNMHYKLLFLYFLTGLMATKLHRTLSKLSCCYKIRVTVGVTYRIGNISNLIISTFIVSVVLFLYYIYHYFTFHPTIIDKVLKYHWKSRHVKKGHLE